MVLLLILLLLAAVILGAVGLYLSRGRKPVEYGPTPEPFTLVAKPSGPGHVYRMRLPDRQKMDLR